MACRVAPTKSRSFMVGAAVGAVVGLVVGAVDGLAVGAVGGNDGLSVVGVPVGEADGLTVGPVGEFVGLAVVGAAVGDAVGGVGAAVPQVNPEFGKLTGSHPFASWSSFIPQLHV